MRNNPSSNLAIITKTSDQPVETPKRSAPTSQDFIHAIRQTLAIGDHKDAARIATQAVELYPHDVELTKMAQILAPPTVAKKKLAPDTSIGANQRWLKENFEAYKDKWVALRNGELVESANTAKELKARLPDFTDMMVTKV